MNSTCKHCGVELVNTPGKRKKEFCGNTCRSNYWQKQKRVEKAKSVETKPESIPEQTVEEPPVTEVPEPPKTESKWVRNEPKKKKEIPPQTQQMRESLVFAQEIQEAETKEQLEVIEKEVNIVISKGRFSPIEEEVVRRVLREKRDKIVNH